MCHFEFNIIQLELKVGEHSTHPPIDARSYVQDPRVLLLAKHYIQQIGCANRNSCKHFTMA